MFSARICGNGFAFDDVSPSAFCDEENRFYAIGLMNSVVFRELLCVLNRGMKTETGNVQKVPFLIDANNKERVSLLSKMSVELVKRNWDDYELSWDFHQHPIIREGINCNQRNIDSTTIEKCFQAWAKECDCLFEQLKDNEEELNRIFIKSYGMQDELTPEIDDKDVSVKRADLQRDIKSLLSYAVGCMFGRYSLNLAELAYAGGVWDETKYGHFKPVADNVIPITDEEYLEDDILSRLCTFLKVAFGEGILEEN